jgi:hypothetical protein
VFGQGFDGRLRKNEKQLRKIVIMKRALRKKKGKRWQLVTLGFDDRLKRQLLTTILIEKD